MRKGAPDAGVECFVSWPDGTEWAWQAKYFPELGDHEWQQIDDSVKVAIDKHPRLARYFVCVPYNRPDARIQGQMSALQKWEAHVKKWTGWAAARSMNVEFVYWGSFELIELLHTAKNSGRLQFWFGKPGFDMPWFASILKRAVDAAGPRYTQDLHVDLPIAQTLRDFGRTPESVAAAKRVAKEVRKSFTGIGFDRIKVDEPMISLVATVRDLMEEALSGFSYLHHDPGKKPTYRDIAGKLSLIVLRCEQLEDPLEILAEAYRQEGSPPRDKDWLGTENENPYTQCGHDLYSFMRMLRKTQRKLVELADLAEKNILIVRGDAGTGKTHLLCDASSTRLEANYPTVLLMGQLFKTNDDPWTQALRILDLAQTSASDFVGALEAAAEASGTRALVVIDAINEGAGRSVWPEHIRPFLDHLTRSPWIGVVLSIRNGYEELILSEVPEHELATVEHFGFSGHEYSAVRSFFEYYGLDLPSTPILSPEFSNPLFLQQLCKGMHGTGERRLPRGYHGISFVFKLFLDSVNKRLARRLDFNVGSPLVWDAVNVFALALVDAGKRWLPRDLAESLVNEKLPGKTYSNSLYAALLDEGVLTEGVDADSRPESEITYVSYERLADHLVVKVLLDRYLDADDPQGSFASDSPLVVEIDKSEYGNVGLLEALFIQVPERAHTELSHLWPEVLRRWRASDALRKSVIWRAIDAINDQTADAMRATTRSSEDLDAWIDILLSVATIPDHRFNADYLCQRLKQSPLPARDSWWSTYLHRAWKSGGPVDRFIDWALSIKASDALEDETVRLASTTLAWMLSTPNRFVRDRATKGLVSLLSGRLGHTEGLVETMSLVDDPYVQERTYAVAYGVSMRCHDADHLGPLAELVYAKIFKDESPPPGILVRDYARGVIERALYLGASLDLGAERIRPPYRSRWPHIPSEEEIHALKKAAPGENNSASKGWGRGRIFNSVLHDDFGRYVIGTNSHTSEWLPIPLEEREWLPRKQALAKLASELSREEARAYSGLQNCGARLIRELDKRQIREFARLLEAAGGATGIDPSSDIWRRSDPSVQTAFQRFRLNSRRAARRVERTFTAEHYLHLEELMGRPVDEGGHHRPDFDLSVIQRYVLWRVFDLGWTDEKFTLFDRYANGYDGRSATKAERVGKKYQWIGYHEILGLVADRFQFWEGHGDAPVSRRYAGPWQVGARDIDPSCTTVGVLGGTGYAPHPPSWWAPVRYDHWPNDERHSRWLSDFSDLPDPIGIIRSIRPEDGQYWLNLNGYFRWREPEEDDEDSTYDNRPEIIYWCDAFLVKRADQSAFEEWLTKTKGDKLWIPEAPRDYTVFLGELGWAPAAQHIRHPYYGDEGWDETRSKCPVKVRSLAFHYLRERGTFDCSIDDTYILRLPNWELIEGMKLRWSGTDATYLDDFGEVTTIDPTVKELGPSALLVRETALRKFLDENEFALYWSIVGEKRVLALGPDRLPITDVHGVYRLTDSGVAGSMRAKARKYRSEKPMVKKS